MRYKRESQDIWEIGKNSEKITNLIKDFKNLQEKLQQSWAEIKNEDDPNSWKIENYLKSVNETLAKLELLDPNKRLEMDLIELIDVYNQVNNLAFPAPIKPTTEKAVEPLKTQEAIKPKKLDLPKAIGFRRKTPKMPENK